jgi:transposase
MRALEELIAGSDKLAAAKRAGLRGKISTMPGLSRFLRVTPGGLLRTDKGKAKAGENLDGKYLLRCADPNMTAEDIALGYKQLLEVERSWRDMKTILELRPVYHRLEERIRARVLRCWLALLLIASLNIDPRERSTSSARRKPDQTRPRPRSRLEKRPAAGHRHVRPGHSTNRRSSRNELRGT